MALKAAIFDMDGVIVDNRDAHLEAFRAFGQLHGLSVKPQRLVPFFGMTNREIMEELFGRQLTEEEVKRFSDEKEAIYRELYYPVIAPAVGLVDLLKSLKSTGLRVAVGSSAPRANVDFVLERCRIAPYFDAIACGSEIARGKPDPEVYLLAAKKLGVDPGECLVFEDAFVGMEAARRAGMRVVAMATTFPRALIEQQGDYDLLIDSFPQVDIALFMSSRA